MSSLQELAALCGIGNEYIDYAGTPRQVDDSVRVALLSAMGHPVQDEAALQSALRALREKPWRSVLPPATVTRCTGPTIKVVVPASPAVTLCEWEIALETGECISGSADLNEPAEKMHLDGVEHWRISLTLPEDIPLGYHRFHLREPVAASGRLILVPERCYQPPALESGQRLWGFAAQLYSLRSERDSGVGDFGVLAEFMPMAAELGADFVGLNPLHALFPANPAHASPYSPSSRSFLNVLYLDLHSMARRWDSPAVRRQLGAAAAQETAQLRTASHVDYTAVANIKLPGLRALHAAFRAIGDGAQDFEKWLAQRGQEVQRLATFDALHAHFLALDPQAWTWKQWPVAFQDPDSEEVQRFRQEHGSEIDFFLFLQWQADEQLAAIQQIALEHGQTIGLYRDLAVGNDPGGAEAWARPNLYCPAASVGAPPDALALKGQDWGLPPIDPQALGDRGYEDFVALLRANMRHCGALRIDHVMGLFRLWWVPAGEDATAGAYVYYPFADLLGILALESQRNRCLVIGEDLGTVPHEIRSALPDAAVYSYRVLYFEKDGHDFHAPDRFPALAMSTVSTHDLAPLYSYWSGTDIDLRERLGIFPSDGTVQDQRAERAGDRAGLLRALQQSGSLGPEADTDPARWPAMTAELALAIHCHAGKASSALLAVQPEDLVGEMDPVNVPGTSVEYPNWSRRLSPPIEQWADSGPVRAACAAISASRKAT